MAGARPHKFFKKQGGTAEEVWANNEDKYNLRFFSLDSMSLDGKWGLVDNMGLTLPDGELDKILRGRGTSESSAIVVAGTSAVAAPPAEVVLQEVVRLLHNIKHELAVREAVRPAFSYSSSSSSSSSSSGKSTTVRDPDFRRRALAAFGYSSYQVSGRSKTVPCLILDHPVPSSALVVGHIFKHQWAEASQALWGIHIDDTGNALPIFKPIESAFDRLRLCIVCEEDHFIVKVLDPSLMPTKMVDAAKQIMGLAWPGTTDTRLASMTFRDIHNKRIKFYNSHRPLKRLLYFHARHARSHAVKRGWVRPDEWVLQDFWSEGDYHAKVMAWLPGIPSETTD